MAPPQSFLSHCAKTMQDRGAAEQPYVHARARIQAAQRKLDPPNIVAAKLPPDKPNLRFALDTIPQGKLTLLMQPQPLAEMHPFAPTLRKWQQGIPVDCGLDWDWSVIEAAVERGTHPMARTPKLIALFCQRHRVSNQGQIFPGVPLGGTQALLASKPQDLPRGGSPPSGTMGANYPQPLVPSLPNHQWGCHCNAEKRE